MIERLLDIVWPRVCEVCGRPVDRPGRYLCSECLMQLPMLPPTGTCRVCGRAACGLDRDYLCEDCRGPERPAFERSAAALKYEGLSRRLIHRYKFRGRLELVPDFADFLEAAVMLRLDRTAIDLILPVPTTRWRRWDRGYNQTEYLARALARRLDRRCAPALLKRIGAPAPQRDLDERERRENVKGTFAVRHPELIRGRTILVVDDVMTTGSTLSECARMLKAAGAARVWAAAVARTMRD